MLSTGNDIVSLNAINVTRTKQPNFYSKILTTTETAHYRQQSFANIPFEIFVWLLWSVKEAAFKFLQRVDPDIIFTPVKFEVGDVQIAPGFELMSFAGTTLTGIGFDGLGAVRSTVKFRDHILFSNSLIYKEFIASVVNSSDNFKETHWGIKQIDKNGAKSQSAEVRAFLAENFTDKNITISKNGNGIPEAIQSDGTIVPVSLSHHENRVAYSFQFGL